MRIRISIAFTLAILCSYFTAFCQNSSLEFVENKGQWDNSIRFKGVMNNGAFFLHANGFTVAQHKAEDLEKLAGYYHAIPEANISTAQAKAVVPQTDNENEKLILHSHSYQVTFLNAGSPTIVPDKVIPTYYNYIIGNDSTKWKGNCKIFQAVTYKNMYKGVDVRYYTDEGKLKYDIIVQPGGDLSKVVMKYDGADALSIVNEQLVIKTSVGEVHEMAPLCLSNCRWF